MFIFDLISRLPEIEKSNILLTCRRPSRTILLGFKSVCFIMNALQQFSILNFLLFLGHMTGNQKISYAAIVQTTVLYHIMKLQIHRFDDKGAITIQYFELRPHFWVT